GCGVRGHGGLSPTLERGRAASGPLGRAVQSHAERGRGARALLPGRGPSFARQPGTSRWRERARDGRRVAPGRARELALACDAPATLAWAPVETVSLSETGFERIYQGSALLFAWALALAP